MAEQSRRGFLSACSAAVAGSVALAGCSGESESPDETCVPETNWTRETVHEDTATRGAGASYSHGVNLEAGDTLHVNVEHVNGTKPTVAVVAPNGSERILLEYVERVDRNVTARQAGQYKVRFENYGAHGDGRWREALVVHRPEQHTVCR